jgi:hypothetical protein
MVVVKTVVRIRREHAGGKSIKAIARVLRLSRKAVRMAIRAPEGAFTYHRTVQPLPRIGPFQERLDTLLTDNEGLPRRERDGARSFNGIEIVSAPERARSRIRLRCRVINAE